MKRFSNKFHKIRKTLDRCEEESSALDKPVKPFFFCLFQRQKKKMFMKITNNLKLTLKYMYRSFNDHH